MTADPDAIGALSRSQQDNLDAVYGVSTAQDTVREAKEAGLLEILARDIPLLRDMEIPLHGYYVRLRTPRGGISACSATKLQRWLWEPGYAPVDELED